MAESARERERETTFISILKYVPVANVLGDIFFHGSLCEERLKDFLDVQGLLSALLLGALISYPGSFEDTELLAASQRVGFCRGWGPLEAADDLRMCVLTGGFLLTLDIFLVVLVYMSFSGLDLPPEGPDPHEPDAKEEKERRFDDWFRHIRWILLASTLCMLAGMFFFVRGSVIAIFLKFPFGSVNMSIEELTNSDEGCGGGGNLQAQMRDTFSWLFVAAAVVTFGILSRAHFRQMDMKEDPEKYKKTNNKVPCCRSNKVAPAWPSASEGEEAGENKNGGAPAPS
ncbi:unnamed protein product [Symbiodinium necroappetens]|uniref:Uncharacterized protein n=1 Tax=Symbiodinium necroappetens TaxID=1628268 RepID=A0A813C480_9DINO|nr:unnamed protein product [Symbiodinium sp. CCMP2456]CAE7933761.1 unnamed protein product [Symbiodinium necroappetens]